MNRRRFLLAGTSLGVGFTAGCTLPVIPKRPAPGPEAAVGWIEARGGGFVLHLPRVEMGQDISTALRQVACEELEVPASAVEVRAHTTDTIAPVAATVGSASVADYAVPLARACATLREALAAGRTAGSLGAADRPIETLRLLRRDARHVGRSPASEAMKAIVTGGALYAGDVRRPGTLYGRVLRAPASPELDSGPRTWDPEAAARTRGFVALVEHPHLRIGRAHGLGLVARTPGALDACERALAVDWHVAGGFDEGALDAATDIDARLARGALAETVAGEGAALDAEGPAAGRGWDVNLRVDVPIAAHGAIEPRSAVAEVDAAGRLHVWAGTQDAFYVRDVLTRRLDLDARDVEVHAMRVGGGFGGKAVCTVELEAALLARAARAPVKVQWTRTQELRHGYHRPASSHRVRASVEGGALGELWHAFAGGNVLLTNAVLPGWLQVATSVIGDRGVSRGAVPPYRAARRRVEFDVVRLPVLSGPWRGLGAGPNAFAIESAIDECARVAGVDPVRFRIDAAESPRLRRVVERAAADAGWPDRSTPDAATGAAADGAAADPGTRRGRGVACGVYKGDSFAAVVASVAVAADGSLALLSLHCAHDCGRVINPDRVRAQCEGNLVWGIGMVLTDGLAITDGAVVATDRAPSPRLSAVPPLHVSLVEDVGTAPAGAGETAIVAAAGAIANAIRDATGVRVARLPVDPRAALALPARAS